METPKGNKVREKEEARWLGVWIDRERNFKGHIKRKMAATERAWESIKRAKGERRGMDPHGIRRMYVACVRSVMEYGAEVFWKGQKWVAEKMDALHKKAIRHFLDQPKTTPMEVLFIEGDIKPSEIRLDEKIRRAGMRAMGMKKGEGIREFWPVDRDRGREDEDDEEWQEEKWGESWEQENRSKSCIYQCAWVLKKWIGGKLRFEDPAGWGETEEVEKACKEVEKEIEKDTEEERRWQKERKRRRGEILMYTDASREEEGCVGVAVVVDHDKDEKTRVKR